MGSKKNTISRMCLILVSLLILTSGCTQRVVYVNNTHTLYRNVTVNNTVYKNITTILPPDVVCPKVVNSNASEEGYTREYILGLIRQLKHYEKIHERYWNHSECFDSLNRTNEELYRAKYELCQWNVSWC